ncbi:MAG: HAMP domain-containing protein [Collinsella sp.]
MALAAVVAICISVVIGSLVSRMLTKPIHRITSTAKQIRDGDLSARTGLRGDDEIDQLGETFDEMATSLEKDMKHEKRLTSTLHTSFARRYGHARNGRGHAGWVYPTDDEHLETVASETRRWLVWCSRCSTYRVWKTARLRSTRTGGHGSVRAIDCEWPGAPVCRP